MRSTTSSAGSATSRATSPTGSRPEEAIPVLTSAPTKSNSSTNPEPPNQRKKRSHGIPSTKHPDRGRAGGRGRAPHELLRDELQAARPARRGPRDGVRRQAGHQPRDDRRGRNTPPGLPGDSAQGA